MMRVLEKTMRFLRSKSLSRWAIHLGCMQGSERDLDCQASHSPCLNRAIPPPDGAVMAILENIVLEEIVPPQ